MAWPRLLVLVRHAESDGNVRTVDERATHEVATHDYALTPRGRAQAEVTAGHVRATYGDFDIRYVSYYRRAKETMEILAPDRKVYEDPRLAEGQRGIYHTMTHDEIARVFPFELKRKEREGLYHYRPLGGENWPDIELRIHSFLGTLARDYAGKSVLIVVHGQWLILFQRLIRHFSIEEALKRYREGVFENASVTTYESDEGGAHLRLVNENIVPWRRVIE
jgi:broad specificity phosphatase PhoE